MINRAAYSLVHVTRITCKGDETIVVMPSIVFCWAVGGIWGFRRCLVTELGRLEARVVCGM